MEQPVTSAPRKNRKSSNRGLSPTRGNGTTVDKSRKSKSKSPTRRRQRSPTPTNNSNNNNNNNNNNTSNSSTAGKTSSRRNLSAFRLFRSERSLNVVPEVSNESSSGSFHFTTGGAAAAHDSSLRKHGNDNGSNHNKNHVNCKPPTIHQVEQALTETLRVPSLVDEDVISRLQEPDQQPEEDSITMVTDKETQLTQQQQQEHPTTKISQQGEGEEDHSDSHDEFWVGIQDHSQGAAAGSNISTASPSVGGVGVIFASRPQMRGGSWATRGSSISSSLRSMSMTSLTSMPSLSSILEHEQQSSLDISEESSSIVSQWTNDSNSTAREGRGLDSNSSNSSTSSTKGTTMATTTILGIPLNLNLARGAANRHLLISNNKNNTRDHLEGKTLECLDSPMIPNTSQNPSAEKRQGRWESERTNSTSSSIDSESTLCTGTASATAASNHDKNPFSKQDLKPSVAKRQLSSGSSCGSLIQAAPFSRDSRIALHTASTASTSISSDISVGSGIGSGNHHNLPSLIGITTTNNNQDRSLVQKKDSNPSIARRRLSDGSSCSSLIQAHFLQDTMINPSCLLQPMAPHRRGSPSSILTSPVLQLQQSHSNSSFTSDNANNSSNTFSTVSPFSSMEMMPPSPLLFE